MKRSISLHRGTGVILVSQKTEFFKTVNVGKIQVLFVEGYVRSFLAFQAVHKTVQMKKD
jgi:hypothetical protein